MVRHIDRVSHQYKGKTYNLEAIKWQCNTCRMEIVNLKEAEKQKKRIELTAEGFLTDHDIKQIRGKLGLTQRAMAEKLGVGAKTFARYENLSVRQSKCMDQLLRILDQYPGIIEGIEGNK